MSTLTGHATAVSLLSFSPDGAFLLSGASNDRFAMLWTLPASGKTASEKMSPVASLASMGEPTAISLSLSHDDEETCHALVACGNSANLWMVSGVSSTASLNMKPHGDVKLGSGGALISASLQLQGSHADVRVMGNVVVACGSLVKPSFYAVPATEEAAIVSSVITDNQSGGSGAGAAGGASLMGVGGTGTQLETSAAADQRAKKAVVSDPKAHAAVGEAVS